MKSVPWSVGYKKSALVWEMAWRWSGTKAFECSIQGEKVQHYDQGPPQKLLNIIWIWLNIPCTFQREKNTVWCPVHEVIFISFMLSFTHRKSEKWKSLTRTEAVGEKISRGGEEEETWDEGEKETSGGGDEMMSDVL